MTFLMRKRREWPINPIADFDPALTFKASLMLVRFFSLGGGA